MRDDPHVDALTTLRSLWAGCLVYFLGCAFSFAILHACMPEYWPGGRIHRDLSDLNALHGILYALQLVAFAFLFGAVIPPILCLTIVGMIPALPMFIAAVQYGRQEWTFWRAFHRITLLHMICSAPFVAFELRDGSVAPLLWAAVFAGWLALGWWIGVIEERPPRPFLSQDPALPLTAETRILKRRAKAE